MYILQSPLQEQLIGLLSKVTLFWLINDVHDVTIV